MPRPHLLLLAMNVRPLDEVDLPEIVRIENASFPDAWSKRKFETHWRRPTVRILVASDFHGRVRGYLVWERQDAPDSGKRFRSGSKCHILNLAVEPEYRRQGIGYELLRPLIAAARAGGSTIIASVPDEWLPAQLFFRASGFRAFGMTHDAHSSWIDFTLRPIDASDAGLMVLRSILQGDGRVVV